MSYGILLFSFLESISFWSIILVYTPLYLLNPKLFEYTADKLGLPANECTYVGDHPINDIQGALDAGMKAIRMNWGWFKGRDLREDVPVIDDIIDVLKYV